MSLPKDSEWQPWASDEPSDRLDTGFFLDRDQVQSSKQHKIDFSTGLTGRPGAHHYPAIVFAFYLERGIRFASSKLMMASILFSSW